MLFQIHQQSLKDEFPYPIISMLILILLLPIPLLQLFHLRFRYLMKQIILRGVLQFDDESNNLKLILIQNKYGGYKSLNNILVKRLF